MIWRIDTVGVSNEGLIIDAKVEVVQLASRKCTVETVTLHLFAGMENPHEAEQAVLLERIIKNVVSRRGEVQEDAS